MKKIFRVLLSFVIIGCFSLCEAAEEKKPSESSGRKVLPSLTAYSSNPAIRISVVHADAVRTGHLAPLAHMPRGGGAVAKPVESEEVPARPPVMFALPGSGVLFISPGKDGLIEGLDVTPTSGILDTSSVTISGDGARGYSPFRFTLKRKKRLAPLEPLPKSEEVLEEFDLGASSDRTSGESVGASTPVARFSLPSRSFGSSGGGAGQATRNEEILPVSWGSLYDKVPNVMVMARNKEDKTAVPLAIPKEKFVHVLLPYNPAQAGKVLKAYITSYAKTDNPIGEYENFVPFERVGITQSRAVLARRWSLRVPQEGYEEFRRVLK